ncbi:hypothetical protein ABZ635_22105 [Nocardiopsis sp. NPDC007018]|uniref:hypothetical protein n=1 Tax=Nocardiopsis sp. NPDC007018 TaxID=3155721 RepID=UPI0033F9D378
MDAATKRAIEGLTRELQRTQSELATVKRASRRPQLGFSSIESGSLDVVDPETGHVRLRLGYQPDGSVGVVPEGGDPPPAPSAPIVAPAPVGLMVSWDGRLAHDLTLPADFDHVSVHVSASPGFTPDASTFQGTIPRAGGLFPVVPLEPGETYYVQLVGVGAGGVEGATSEERSGVPDSVGGVPGPGSITETEIADDAVTSPKIRALAIEAHHIVASAIEAGHITAGAVTASKLAATIVLASRLVAGDPSAARVEIDEDGLRGYDDEGALVFAVQDGSAVFTGDITGSEITGGRLTIGAAPGNNGAIEDTGTLVRSHVTSMSGAQALIAASAIQAECSVWGDTGNSESPAGGMVAAPDRVGMVLYSRGGDTSAPYSQISAMPGEAAAQWRSATGSDVRIRSLPDWSSIALTAPAAADPDDAQGAGVIFTQRYASDIAAVSVQGPVWSSGSGPERGARSMIHAEGARPNRPYSRMTYSGARHLLQQQWNAQTETRDTSDGVVELAPEMSLLTSRHAPVRSELTTQLTGFSTGTSFYDFPSETWEPWDFKTSWSGRTRITIVMSGLNNASDASSVALGFRLSGASTLAASLKRSAFIRSAGAGFGSTQQASFIDTLHLSGNANYTITPCYRITSGSVAFFDLALPTHIIFEPLT